MHPAIIAQRKAAAMQTIVERSKALSELEYVEPALVDELDARGYRVPAVIEVMRLEALAKILGAVAESVGAEPAPETENQLTAFVAPPPTEDPLPPPAANEPAEEAPTTRRTTRKTSRRK